MTEQHDDLCLKKDLSIRECNCYFYAQVRADEREKVALIDASCHGYACGAFFGGPCDCVRSGS